MAESQQSHPSQQRLPDEKPEQRSGNRFFTRTYRIIGGTLNAVDKKNGAVIQTSTTTVSNDGQTMTIQFVRSASAMTWTEVLDRVK